MGVEKGSATMDTSHLFNNLRPDDNEIYEPNARGLREYGTRKVETGIRVQLHDLGKRARGRDGSRDVRAWAHFDTGISAMGSPRCKLPRAECVCVCVNSSRPCVSMHVAIGAGMGLPAMARPLAAVPEAHCQAVGSH